MRLLRQPALPPKPADQLYQSGCQIADRLNLDCMVITRMIGTEPDSAGNQERTVLLRRGVPTALDPPQSAAKPIALPRDRADHLLIGSVIAANVVTHLPPSIPWNCCWANLRRSPEPVVLDNQLAGYHRHRW
jgi:hypothetical protein